MSDTTFSKILFPALLSTGAVFTALAAPVVMFGGEKLEIRQGNNSPIFAGDVRGIALPYLGLAGFASVGLGLSGVAVGGWRKTAKRAAQLDDRVTQMQHKMAEKDEYLRNALTTQGYLERSGLDFFLEDEAASPMSNVSSATFMPERLSVPQQEATTRMQSPPTITPPPTPIVTPTTIPPKRSEVPGYSTHYQAPVTITTIVPASHLNVQAAVTPLTAAQGFLSFSRPIMVNPADSPPTLAPPQEVVTPQPTPQSPPQPTVVPAANAMNAADALTLEKIQTLQNQLQQIVVQIEALQTKLVPEIATTQPETDSQIPWRPWTAETAWPVTRRAAS